MNQIHPLDYNNEHHHLYVYKLQDAPEHLVVIVGDDYQSTLYLYALHERGGDYNSARIAWADDDETVYDLIRVLLQIDDRAQFEAIDLESWAHAFHMDRPLEYTACWHYGSHYAHSPFALATVLEHAGLTTVDQLKDSNHIHQLIAKTLTPTSEPSPVRPYGRARVMLGMSHDLKDRRIDLCVTRDSFEHCTAHMTLDEARTVYAKLGKLIAQLCNT